MKIYIVNITKTFDGEEKEFVALPFISKSVMNKFIDNKTEEYKQDLNADNTECYGSVEFGYATMTDGYNTVEFNINEYETDDMDTDPESVVTEPKTVSERLAEQSHDDIDDLYEEFTSHGISICREDYECLPAPMVAHKFTDEQMQKLVDDIWHSMDIDGVTAEQINEYNRYINNEIELNEDAEYAEDAFWRNMEKCAIDAGMEYYEDLEED